MDLSVAEPALCALVSAVSGLPAAACLFENMPRPLGSPLALLSWVSRRGVGLDGVTWAYEAATDPMEEMTPTVQGSREASLQIAVEVYADQRSGHNAASIVEHIRTRLDRPSSRAALEAAGLALATKGPATQADYKADGRMVSRSLFEVVLNGRATEADTAGRTSYIATVEVTAALEGVDGDALSDSIQPSQG